MNDIPDLPHRIELDTIDFLKKQQWVIAGYAVAVHAAMFTVCSQLKPSSNAACGTDLIAARQASRTVNNAAVRSNSHISITLTGNPGVAQVLWVEQRAGSFTLHLTQNVTNATGFTYLIVEPFP